MAPTTTKSSDEVLLGAGTLYVAPIGTTEPASASATLASSWREVGYTDDGSAYGFTYTNEGIEVEEEFYPVKYATTKVELSVGFAMKQASRRNLALALNAGADAASDGTSFEPPEPGDEVRVMLCYDTEDGARWIFRKAFQGGTVDITRKKAPDAALIPVSFRIEKPTSAAPFRVYPTAAGLI